jgi:hypothetical protein
MHGSRPSCSRVLLDRVSENDRLSHELRENMALKRLKGVKRSLETMTADK